MPHTIAENLTRLQNAKTAIGNAITAKGGTVASGDGLEEYAADIATIPSVDAYTKAEADAKFETITDAASTYLSKTDAASKTNKFIFTSNVVNEEGSLYLIYLIPFTDYDYNDFVGGAIGILDYDGSPANQIFLLHMPSTPGRGTAYCITNNALDPWISYNPGYHIRIEFTLPENFLPVGTPVNLKIIV